MDGIVEQTIMIKPESPVCDSQLERVRAVVTPLPWVEKYRPKTLDALFGNQNLIEKIKILLKQGMFPNSIIAGPPGTGKTTTVHCIARTLLKSKYKKGILELNASDQRGIEIVRQQIKTFAQQESKSLGSFKFVILDEADSMTASAQQALRAIIEKSSNSTRFVFICNDSSKLIEPIQSQCHIFRFEPLSSKEMICRLEYILRQEFTPSNDNRCIQPPLALRLQMETKDSCDKNDDPSFSGANRRGGDCGNEFDVRLDKNDDFSSALQLIVDISNGDLRKAINILQSIVTTYGTLRLKEVEEMTRKDNIQEEVRQLMLKIKKRDVVQCISCIRNWIDLHGLSVVTVLNQIGIYLQSSQIDSSCSLQQFTLMTEVLAQTKVEVLQGANPLLQLNALVCSLILLFSQKV